MGKSPFNFYEQVRFTAPDPERRHLLGGYGVVLGMVEIPSGESWYYSIWVDREAECWCFHEHELEATGRQFVERDLRDGSSIRVRVDEQGLGEIVSS